MKKFLFASLLISSFVAACCISACKDDNTVESSVFLPNERPYGKTYAEWTVIWVQQFMTANCANNPWLNSANVLFYKSGPVYMMAGLSTKGASVNVTIPQDKALLFPLVNLFNDYPCPDSTFKPAPDQSMQDFLKTGAESYLPAATGLAVEVDGVSISNPETYKFTSDLFYFTGNPQLASCVDGCVTGEPQPCVTIGYYMMVKPMTKGQHTIHYHIDIPAWNTGQDGTYKVTVE